MRMLGDAKQHISCFKPPKNSARGFYCCIFDKAGGNYRATVNSRLLEQLPYSQPPSSHRGRGEDAALVVRNEMKITQWKKNTRASGYKPNFSGVILIQCKVIYIFWAPIKHVC